MNKLAGVVAALVVVAVVGFFSSMVQANIPRYEEYALLQADPIPEPTLIDRWSDALSELESAIARVDDLLGLEKWAGRRKTLEKLKEVLEDYQYFLQNENEIFEPQIEIIEGDLYYTDLILGKFERGEVK